MRKFFILALCCLMVTTAALGADAPPQTATDQIVDLMHTLTPDKRSALEDRLSDEKSVAKNPFAIAFYKPTYLLPAYYTATPDQAVYAGTTPNNQALNSLEFKAQLSLKVPVLTNVTRLGDLFIGYTQLSYWQFYAKSQYFRETNYEPELFLATRLIPNWMLYSGAVHQSNGRGGTLERSWNRFYLDLTFSGEHWLVSLKPWIPIFKAESSSLHNPDITRYLGYGRILLAYKFNTHHTVSLKLRNVLASGFKRPAIEMDYSFPIHGAISGYLQFFSGYGQSLIEYNHRTNAVGIGISLNNWI